MNETLPHIHTGAATLGFVQDRVMDLMGNFRFNIASIRASDLHAGLDELTGRLLQTDHSDYDSELVCNLCIELETLKSQCRFNMLAIRPAEVHASLQRMFELSNEAIALRAQKLSSAPSLN